MNNEVLRRKMFRTVLADSRAPAGILASSPEMVRTVQKRNGGAQAGSYELNLIPELVQRGDVQALQALTAPSYPKEVRIAASQALGAATVDRRPAPNFPVSLDFSRSGQPLSDEPNYLSLKDQFEARPLKDASIRPAISAVADEVSRRAKIAGQTISKDLSEVFGPDADKGIRNALTSGVRSLKYATGLAGVGEEGGLGSEPTAGVGKTRAQLLEEEASAAQDIAGSPVMGANRPAVDDDLEAGMAGDVPPITPAEELAAGQGSTNTDTSPSKTGGDKPSKSNVNENKLNGMLQQAAAGTLITPSGKTKVKLNPDEAATPQAAAVFKDLVRPEDTSLSDMEERAKQIMGFDPDKAKADKKDAFWRNLTMAGLAIAAGESENALTNVAKGLMVGLDSYSKDIKEISAQDAELQKEYRATLRDLVKTDRDEKIALATVENNYNAAKTDFEQRRDEFNTEQEYKQAVLGLDIEKFNKQALITLSTTLAELEIKQQTLDETVAQNAVSNKLTEFKNQPEIKKLGIAIGYVDSETNEWTEDGLAWLDKTGRDAIMDLELLTGSSKNKTTDSDRDTAALAKFAAGDRSGPVVSRVIAMFPKALEEPELIPEALAALGANTSGANTGSAQIPEFDVEPDGQTLEALAKSGVTQIKVGGKTFPIVQSN